MSRSTFYSTILLLSSTCLVFSPNSTAQLRSGVLGSSTPDGKYSVKGTVVNSVTGKPIPRALVWLRLPALQAVLSGPDGEFQFGGLLSAEAEVEAEKPGFTSVVESLWDLMSRKARKTGPETGPIILKLEPEAVISGHVEDANGEPVQGALCQTFEVGVVNGRKERIQGPNGRTNQDGNFHITRLHAGRYYIAVQANTPSAGVPPAQNQSRKRGYPTIVYYPASPDIESATPLDVAHGQRTAISISLTRGPLFRVSGKVSGPLSQFQAIGILNESGTYDVAPPIGIDAHTGAFDIGTLSAGAYVLRTDGQGFRADLTLKVASDVTDIVWSPSPQPAVKIPVDLRREDVGPEGYDLLVFLRPMGPLRDTVFSSGYDEDSGRLAIKDVLPGKYSVEVLLFNSDSDELLKNGAGPGRFMYVQSVRRGSVDLLRDELVVVSEATPLPIEIVLGDDSATLTGKVSAEGPNKAGDVLIVPEFAPMQGPRVVAASAGGEFQANGLAPGDYRIFVFDSADRIEFTNPSALAKYVSRATNVTLSPNGKTNVTVNLIREND